jgi:hypothetical protein
MKPEGREEQEEQEGREVEKNGSGRESVRDAGRLRTLEIEENDDDRKVGC